MLHVVYALSPAYSELSQTLLSSINKHFTAWTFTAYRETLLQFRLW